MGRALYWIGRYCAAHPLRVLLAWNEATIVLSGGKTGEADYNPIAGCGNFDNGQVKLAVGASATGCVTFQVANGQKIAEVRYGNSVYPGITAQWQLPG
jgi:hypothetical protein